MPPSLRYALMTFVVMLAAVGCLTVALAQAQPKGQFLEAEDFDSTGGWRVVRESAPVRLASGAAVLEGVVPFGDAVARATVTLSSSGNHRIWARFRHDASGRASFRLLISQGGVELFSQSFPTPGMAVASDGPFVWSSGDARLPKGEVEISLVPGQNSGRGRLPQVDCILIGAAGSEQPDHLEHGPRVYMRVTLAPGEGSPVYLHLFADYYQRKERDNLVISAAGLSRRWPKRSADFLRPGTQSPWVDLTDVFCRYGGVRLGMAFRSTAGYTGPAPMRAKLEFADQPREDAIRRVIERDEDAQYGAVYLRSPALTTGANALTFVVDEQYAQQMGHIADTMTWPTVGKAPQRYPFFVTEQTDSGGTNGMPAQRVVQRERQTLDRFGFTSSDLHINGGLWSFRRNKCYHQVDVEGMRAMAMKRAQAFRDAGGDASRLVYAMLTDEPQGHTAAHLAGCSVCRDAFVAWLRDDLRLTPQALLVEDWQQVRPVLETDRTTFPALHYFTQRFRTRSLADYIHLQTRTTHEAYGYPIPVNVNISGGNAVYHANFYVQGVDYFELLGDGRVNALWSADWANFASTYQMGGYNAALMRAASQRHGQHLGMYLIAHAGRLAWDIKAKAVSQAARGIRTLKSFYYGPVYSRNEGGPWSQRPDVWYSHAEVVREIGAAEDILVNAQPVPARTAILYASSSDIWTRAGGNFAWSFDRKHLWLALTHQQIPVDFVHEADVATGALAGYKVCYMAGPNLVADAADALEQWVRNGGTLVLTAGAATRDEFDRPLASMAAWLPAIRSDVAVIERFSSHGRALNRLRPQGSASIGEATLEVLAVRQNMEPTGNAQVLGRFDDGSPAVVRGHHGKGEVYCFAMLPGLSYIKPALDAREEAQSAQGAAATQDEAATVRDNDDDAERGSDADDIALSATPPSDPLTRSYCPWQFPENIGKVIGEPIRQAGVIPPVRCNRPLIDAVLMQAPDACLVPLVNWSLHPVHDLALTVRTDRPVREVESVHHGKLPFTRGQTHEVSFTLPLRETDFIILRH